MPFTAGGDSYYLGANDGHHVVVIRSGVQLRIDPSNALDGDLLPSVTEDLTMEELLPLRWKRT